MKNLILILVMFFIAGCTWLDDRCPVNYYSDRPKFAWVPKHMPTGYVVWLETYYEKNKCIIIHKDPEWVIVETFQESY